MDINDSLNRMHLAALRVAPADTFEALSAAERHTIEDARYPSREDARAAIATLPPLRQAREMWSVGRSGLDRTQWQVVVVSRARQPWAPPEMPCADGSPDPYDA